MKKIIALPETVLKLFKHIIAGKPGRREVLNARFSSYRLTAFPAKKTLLICALFLPAGLLVSCKTEKDITTQGSVLPIDQHTRISSGFGETSANKATTNKAVEGLNIKKELDVYNIPMLPDVTVMPWRDYYQSFNRNADKLSPEALAYCKKTLIEVYEIYREKVQPAEMMQLFSLLQNFTDKKYSGYKVIYYYLVWFRDSGLFNDQWRAIQAKVAGYAVAAKPDPSKPDSEILEKNPQFKAEVQRLIEMMKDRDSYIEKIKAL